jgi:hypothetical protein
MAQGGEFCLQVAQTKADVFMANGLLATNLIMRRGCGRDGITPINLVCS